MTSRCIRVAFDLRWVRRDPGGITEHTLGLLSNMLRLGSEFRFTVILNPGMEPLLASHGCDVAVLELPGMAITAGNTGTLTVGYSQFSPWNHVLMPGKLANLGIDVYHSPFYLGFLRRCRFKVVVTVHDLMALRFPERFRHGRSVRFYAAFAWALRRSLQTADSILANSQATARDIREYLPSVAHKTEVVLHAAHHRFYEPQDPEAVRRLRLRHANSRYLILYVGRRDPHKNVVALIRALALLRNRRVDVGLVLAGNPDRRFPEPENAARELGIAQYVQSAGFVPPAELPLLYHAADVLAFPSLYEGFGLPPLEAMASGLPVVTTSRASIPEVVGDAAVFVEPENPENIARGIELVLTNQALREDLILRGLARAKEFSWEATAGRVLDTYRRLYVTSTGRPSQKKSPSPSAE